MRAQVNKIRESLEMVVRNSSAAGLRQPHLERTRLCQLSDAELDPVYVRQRDALRETVRQLARPKRVNGQVRAAHMGAPSGCRRGCSANICMQSLSSKAGSRTLPRNCCESRHPHDPASAEGCVESAGDDRPCTGRAD